MILLLGAAHAQQIPTAPPGTAQLVAAAGWRRVVDAGVEVAPLPGLAASLTAGLRYDRPAWTPMATVLVRAGAPVGPLGLGARVSGEWLGGWLDHGRLAGADLRAFGIVESAPNADWRVHGGLGVQLIVAEQIPTMGCLAARTGVSVALGSKTTGALDLETPVARLFGPDVPGVDLQATARIAITL